MKKLFFIIVLFVCSIPATATHVAGGELFYEYLGPGAAAGTSTYRITLRLFRDCVLNLGPLLENEVVIVGIYENNTKILNGDLSLPRIGPVTSISLNTGALPCLVGDPRVCYQIGIYSAITTLPDNLNGYTLARYGQYRIDNISNLSQPKQVGSTYTTTIPGKLSLPSGHNSSPQFNLKDTALVCANKSFTLDFGATDADHDSLTYSFCDAYLSTINNTASPPQILNLVPVPYNSPYNGAFPLGYTVKINPATGIISGIAPPVIPSKFGYVVNVCITEWRNGTPISEHRKDFILKVQECDIIEADLPDKIVQCKDSTVHFENQSTSSGITSYLWEFGDNTLNTSNAATVDYHYADTGRYMARLTVTGPKGCVGSDSALVLVYPGFQPAFNVVGGCYFNPYQFNDLSVTKYGFVNSWRWDFGDGTTDADTSHLQNPVYKYPAPSTKIITLVVTSSKGCIDSLHQDFIVRDKPLLQLPFKDTLICNIDTLAIPVLNQGVFSWLPNKNILFANTSKPLVFPKDTTQYIVTVNDNGCINSDTVTVNVLPFITVDLGKDTLICKTDPITLRPISYALQYQWASSSGEVLPNIKFPVARPLVNTKYYVTANLGRCQDRDSVTIKVVPYPLVIAGPDTTICIGSRILLHATVKASSLTWSPAASLTAANIPNPVAGPSKTTAYILKVSDTLGCPKPVSDTLIVTVVPSIIANAGRDTVALPGQPIQLMASGSQFYNWSPESGLNDPSIYNPIATLDAGIDSIRYKVRVSDRNGCFAEDDVVIRVYKTGPEIFVPSAFTPNGDGKNDVLRPVTVGISDLHYFKVFNRWGQLLFSTTELGKGWDGIFNGAPQPIGTYVYVVEGADYKGKTVLRKGTAVLIR